MRSNELEFVDVGEFVREWVAPSGDVTAETTTEQLECVCRDWLKQAEEEGVAIDGSLIEGLTELREHLRS